MTDQADQDVLQMADDIRNKQRKDEEQIYEHERDRWLKSKLGKYYKERYFSGAHDEAFRVFWVRDTDYGRYLKIDEIKFAHIGHFYMGEGSMSHSELEVGHFEGDVPWYQEISEIEFLEYLHKFLELTGWKEKLDKETDH